MLNLPDSNLLRRTDESRVIVPVPGTDVVLLKTAFSSAISRQWQKYVTGPIAPYQHVLSEAEFAKARFIGEMYARACYSMLMVSNRGPMQLRIPIWLSGLLPLSRRLTIQLVSVLLAGSEYLLAEGVHRPLLLTSALMGILDVVLDDAAPAGGGAAFRVASLFTPQFPVDILPRERLIVSLVGAVREKESAWQSVYWERVLQPALSEYCRAEVLATEQIPDSTGMGHRWAGIDAAIKGMWYAVGREMGLHGDLSQFERSRWNQAQMWMADTSLLMQMLDDWVDQEEDRGRRLTPVTSGDWTLHSAQQLYEKTIRDLNLLLDESGISKPVVRTLFIDLYNDYLHTAMNAMRGGVAA